MPVEVAPDEVESLRSVFHQVGGIPIHSRVSVRDLGDSLPIIFVHGLGVSTRYMEPSMALLARERTVAGLDLPGFGRSGTPSRALRLYELADSLARWLDMRGTPRALFVGNSFGCQVIVDLVVREPHRAAGLVLNAPTMDPAHRSVLGQLSRVIADIPREPASLAMHVARDYLRAGPLRLLATLRTALADRIEEKLPKLDAPVSVICGARDPVVTVEWAEEVTQLVGRERPRPAGATLHVVKEAAHAMPYDDPEAFCALVRKLANRLSPP